MSNRIIKLASKKNENEEKLERLEDGFSTYVNGAHKKNEHYKPRHTTSRPSSSAGDKKSTLAINPRTRNLIRNTAQQHLSSPSRSPLELLAKEHNNAAAAGATRRKKWSKSNTSFIIKTSDGIDIKINANSASATTAGAASKTSNKTNNRKTSSGQSSSTSDVNNSSSCSMHDSNDSEAQACYSDDFISDEDDYDDDDDGDDEIEEDLEVNSMDKSTKKKDTERMENNRPASSGLFKSVRFSDTSDDDDEDNSRQPRSNKVIQLNLSSKNAQVIFVVVVSIVTY